MADRKTDPFQSPNAPKPNRATRRKRAGQARKPERERPGDLRRMARRPDQRPPRFPGRLGGR